MFQQWGIQSIKHFPFEKMKSMGRGEKSAVLLKSLQFILKFIAFWTKYFFYATTEVLINTTYYQRYFNFQIQMNSTTVVARINANIGMFTFQTLCYGL